MHDASAEFARLLTKFYENKVIQANKQRNKDSLFKALYLLATLRTLSSKHYLHVNLYAKFYK